MPEISKYAMVDKGASLADDVRVGPFARIGPQVRIEPGCVIENNVTITGRTVLGAKTRVFPMAAIGVGQDGGDGGPCLIGQATSIREHVVIHGGLDGPTRIGSDNLIMIACQVGAGACLGDHGIFANCTRIGAGAVVEDYVGTSGFAVIGPGAGVGAYTFIAGYATVDRYAPPFAIVQGPPFRVRGVNAEKLRRCGFGEDDIRVLKNAFRDLFNDFSDHARPELLEELSPEVADHPHVQRLIEFIRRNASKGADRHG